jgi:hypothetical protein
VLPRTYDDQVCSVARALEAIGDRWTLLVIRDAFHGVSRARLRCDRCGESITALNAEARQPVPSAG